MSVYSPFKKDEDFGSTWGSGGKTAKMKASQWCYDNNYYDATIEDGGNWNFRAKCSSTIPIDWSKPYSDESAREAGFSDRSGGADDSCIKKGFSGADRGNWRDKGEWFFSNKCSPYPNGTPVKCLNENNDKIYRLEGDVLRYYPSPDIADSWDQNWRDFKKINDCSRFTTGEPMYKKVPCKKDEDFSSMWGSSGKTAKMKAAQVCFNINKFNADIKDCGNWNFSADCSGEIPVDWSKPYSDESAREEGFSDRNAAAKADCIKKGFVGIDPSKWQDKGQWFYSLQCSNRDVKWDQSYTGCDGAGNVLTLKKCNNWVDNDPTSCRDSPTKPANIKKWIKCAIGSSPGGIATGDGATACSPLNDNFDCAIGQNCFAVTDIKQDSSCGNTLISNPFGFFKDTFANIGNSFYTIIIIIVIAIILGFIF